MAEKVSFWTTTFDMYDPSPSL